MSITQSTITIQCDACLQPFEADRWDVRHGLTLCDDCNDDFASSHDDDVFESALWVKAGRNER